MPNCTMVLDIGPGLVQVLLQVLSLAGIVYGGYHASQAATQAKNAAMDAKVAANGHSVTPA